MDISACVVNALRQAASCVTGAARRSIQAMAAHNYCGGSSRHAETVFGWNRHAVASGILEVESGQVSFAMNTGTTTSDSIVDALEYWWQQRGCLFPETRTRMIDLDNGPDVASNRSLFIKRLTQFVDRVGLTIELVYYPPYHSKYNAVERCWSALERHWNGSILRTIEDVIKWAETMTWKKIHPIVWIQDQVYARDVRLSRSEKKIWSARLNRREGLEPWSLKIAPLTPLPT